MKKIILLALFCFAAPAPCAAKELRNGQAKKLTPQVMIEAVIEVFTCTPENPTVKIVQVEEINGRRRVVQGHNAKFKPPRKGQGE